MVQRSQPWESKDGSRSARSREAIGGTDVGALDGGIRVELVARVRKEIADGTYDTPEKLEAALERLIARLDLD
jgi:negative regulator of flagellin synthesis FlgM